MREILIIFTMIGMGKFHEKEDTDCKLRWGECNSIVEFENTQLHVKKKCMNIAMQHSWSDLTHNTTKYLVLSMAKIVLQAVIDSIIFF